ncbi:hypothetical protein TWF173_004044 [Orbilia oligospora]|nr:hypothetical protein TWF173_004044 [Orbilia oligospora]
MEDFNDMIICFPAIFRFSNTTGLVIKIKRSGSIERRLYVAISRLLRTFMLPMPPDLDIRELYGIRGIDLDVDDVDGGLKIVETAAGGTGDNYERSRFPPDVQKFLGPPISDEEFKELVTTEIQFPKKLRSFKFSTRASKRDTCGLLFLLPLIRCKELTTLSIENVIEETKFEEEGEGGEETSKNRPIYSFPTIKSLHLTDVTKFNHIPSTVPIQFPNLESFKITKSKYISRSTREEYNTSWPGVIPEIPTLRFAEISPPSVVTMGPYGNPWMLEEGLNRRTSEGWLPGLKTVNILHEDEQQIAFVGTRAVVSLCRFRRKSNHEISDSRKTWVQIDE